MNSLVLTGVLTDEELATVVTECEPHFKNDFTEGRIIGGNSAGVRRSEVKFIDLGIPNTIQIGFDLLYRACGNLKLDCYNYPDIQFLKYPAGGFYHWHTDEMKHTTEGMYRGMSLSLTLNDAFQGGGLEIKDGGEYVQAPNTKGGFAIFSAFHFHRALTVTEGERRSLTLWFPCKESTLRQIRSYLREGSRTPPPD